MITLSWIAVAALTRLLERTWFSPGSFLALTLCASSIGSAVFAPEYFQSAEANLYLQVLVVVTSAGVLIGQSGGATRSSSMAGPRAFTIDRKAPFIALGMTASLISVLLTLRTVGVQLNQLVSTDAIRRLAQQVTYQRYTEGFDFPVVYNISNAVVVAYGIVVALHFTANRRVEWPMLVPLGIYGASFILITARVSLIFLVSLMVFGAIYVDKIVSATGQFVRLSNRRFIVIASALVILLITISVAFQMLRFGEGNPRSLAEVSTHLRRWPLGSLSAFSHWFENARPGFASDKPPGYYTFMGIFDNLGIAARQTRTYEDFVTLTWAESTNVYTAFRGMYHDFGLLGSACFVFLIGLAGGLAVGGRLSGTLTNLCLYLLTMSFVSMAFIVSFWAYTANIVAVILVPLLLRLFSTTSANPGVPRKARNRIAVKTHG